MKSTFGDNRTADILLALCRPHTVSLAALARRLDVSERTVRNDVKQLNEDLMGCAAIEGGQGQYTLRIYDAQRFQTAKTRLLEDDGCFNSPRNRMDYLFGRLMRATEPLLTDDLAYEMSVGRTTLVSDLKKLRGELEPYRLSILGKTSKGLVLEGRESDIRQYILERAYDSLYQDYPMDPEIDAMAEEAFADSPFERGGSFQKFLTVVLDRFLTGHPLEELAPAFYSLTVRKEFLVLDGLMEEIGRFLHVEFPAEEKLFALLPIVGMRTSADVRDMRTIELDRAMEPLKDEIFRRIQMEMNIRLATPEFIDEFLYHLMFMINRLRFHVRLKSAVLSELLEKYPLAWQMAGIAARVIREEYGVEVTEDEKGYLASYFGVFLEESGRRGHPFRAAGGMDIARVMEGCRDACARYKNADFLQNDAMLYAALRFLMLMKGKKLEVLASYEPALTMFGEWYEQLMAESEGKDGKGLFPVSAGFTTDLHSIGQFIQDGSRMMFETVLWVDNAQRELLVPDDPDGADGLNFAAGMRLQTINEKAMKGTLLAHVDGGTPNVVVTVDRLDDYTFGELVYFFWKSLAVSGYMIGVNPFDQPGVEAYKKNMFALLGKPGYDQQRSALESRLRTLE